MISILRPAAGGVATPARARRTLAAGLSVALAATMGGVMALPAQAADIAGGSWSTTYESGQPQADASNAEAASVNLRGETDAVHDLVASVSSPDPGANSETVSKIFDRNPNTPGATSGTKWFVGRQPSTGSPVEAIYTLTAAAKVTGYKLVSGGDEQPRDPKSWQVYGSNTASAATAVGDASWQLIDTASNQNFVVSSGNRWVSLWQTIDTPSSYQYYKIRVTETYTGSGTFQLGEWDLLSTDGVVASTLTSKVDDGRANPGASGTRAVRYAGATMAAGAASATNVLHSGLNVAIGSNTALSYQIRPGNAAGAAAAVDVEYTDADGNNPGRLSALAGAVDSLGRSVTAASHATTLTVGQWNTVTVDLSSLAGKKITRVFLSYDNPTNADASQLSGWIDNVTIADNALAGNSRVVGSTNVATRTNEVVTPKLGVLSGRDIAKSTTVLAATINLNDGLTSAQPLDIAAGSAGYTLAFPTTYRFTKAGLYNATISVTVTAGSSAPVTVTAPVTLTVVNDARATTAFAEAANVKCITVSGVGADCDGNGWAYDKSKLAAQGMIQGQTNTFNVGSTPFYYEMPNIASGQNDAIFPAGQKVAVHLGTGATQISILGLANEGARSTTLTLHFTDGSTQDVPVAFGDWTGASSSPIAGNTVVAFSDGRLKIDGTDNGKAAVYATTPVTLALDQNSVPKVVDWVGFAAQNGNIKPEGQVHVVAFASDVTPPTVSPEVTGTAAAAQTATVGTSFTGDLATVAGGTGTFTAAINWGDGSPLVDGTVTNGTISGTHTYTEPGDYTVTVVTSSGGRGLTTSSVITVVKKTSSVTLASSSSQIDLAGSATLSATVAPAGATGSVEFFADSASVGSAVVNGSGVAQLAVAGSTLGVAQHSLTAVYSGDSHTTGSTTNAIPVTVTKIATNVSLAASPTSAVVGSTVALTATVTPSSAAGGSSVEFFDGTTSLGTATPVNGVATLSVSALAAGTHSLTAKYLGDASHTASAASSAVSVTVTKKALTPWTVSGPSADVVVGAAATVAVTLPSAATGSVTVKEGSTTLGTATISNGVATFSTSTLSVGTHILTVSYQGDANYVAGADKTVSITIVKKSSTVTLTVPAGDLTVGAAVPVTATVQSATATGTVQFLVDGVNFGSAVTVAGGAASASLTGLAIGTHTVSATYSGDSQNAGASSVNQSITVIKKTPVVSLVGPAAAITLGDTATVNATLPADASGTVQFVVDSVESGAAVVVAAGHASTTLSDLSLGSHQITAVYSGDAATYNGAASAAVTVTIVKKTASVTVAASATSLTTGDPVTLTATVTGAGATGVVEFRDGTVVVGSGTLSAEGVATFTVAAVPVGTHSYSAVYVGDDVFATASSAATMVTATNAVIPGTDVVVSAPTFSKAKQSYDSVGSARATVSAQVTGTTAGTVTFKAGTKSLGSAKVVKVGTRYSATLTLAGKLKIGSYAKVTASYVSSSVPVVSAPAATTLKVVKASTKSVKVQAKKFTAGTRPTLKVSVAKLDNGRWAFGQVKVMVKGKTVVSKKITVKNKGKITVRLPQAYSSSIKVKAKFMPKSSAKVNAKSSKTVTVKTR